MKDKVPPIAPDPGIKGQFHFVKNLKPLIASVSSEDHSQNVCINHT